MSIDLEYAIKQDIRNNPVVREVDRSQKRQFVYTLVWAAAVIGMAMFALIPRQRLSESGYDLQKIREDLAQERDARRQYEIELQRLLRPDALGPRAAHERQMRSPGEADTLVLLRVPPAQPASRAIVAAAR